MSYLLTSDMLQTGPRCTNDFCFLVEGTSAAFLLPAAGPLLSEPEVELSGIDPDFIGNLELERTGKD